MQMKKIMAVMLAAMTLVSTCTTAFAADQVFTEDGTANVPVTCEIESSYKVKLPAIVALSKNTEVETKNAYGSEYIVGVSGNIDSDKFVNVEPDTTDFVLKDASGKRPVTPELTAEKVAWSAEDLDKAEDDTFVDSTSAVSAVIPKAGKYSGTIVYNFALSEIATENRHSKTNETNIEEEAKTIGTLRLSATSAPITKVKIDDTEYTTFTTKMPVKAGSKITFYHDSNRTWSYNSNGVQSIELGQGEICHFVIPDSASGDARLDVVRESGGEIFILYGSSGWITGLVPSLGE